MPNIYSTLDEILYRAIFYESNTTVQGAYLLYTVVQQKYRVEWDFVQFYRMPRSYSIFLWLYSIIFGDTAFFGHTVQYLVLVILFLLQTHSTYLLLIIQYLFLIIQYLFLVMQYLFLIMHYLVLAIQFLLGILFLVQTHSTYLLLIIQYLFLIMQYLFLIMQYLF